MAYTFFMPPVSYMGANALESIIEEIKTRNLSKASIVTDKILIEIGLINKLTELLEKTKIEYFIFDKTKPNPTVTNVKEGLNLFEENNCDFFISFGGGFTS